MAKKRIIVLGLLLVLFLTYFVIRVSAEGPQGPGQQDPGGNQTPGQGQQVPNQAPDQQQQQPQQALQQPKPEHEVQENVFGIIVADDVILREGPTKNSKSLGKYSKGTKFELVVGPDMEVDPGDEYGVRVKVKIQGKVGYIAQRYVRFIEGRADEWELISIATTKASPNSARDTNIAIASGMITEKWLEPGEKFDFWKTVGKCTYEKGYKDATVYQSGQKVTGIGGGVCQVSTTLNMAAKQAGIPTNAKQHSLPVSYAKREDEATVSYGNQNFTFVNTTGRTIMLVMYSGDGACTCEIWGRVEN